MGCQPQQEYLDAGVDAVDDNWTIGIQLDGLLVEASPSYRVFRIASLPTGAFAVVAPAKTTACMCCACQNNSQYETLFLEPDDQSGQSNSATPGQKLSQAPTSPKAEAESLDQGSLFCRVGFFRSRKTETLIATPHTETCSRTTPQNRRL